MAPWVLTVAGSISLKMCTLDSSKNGKPEGVYQPEL